MFKTTDYTASVRDYIMQTSAAELAKDFGHDECNGKEQMLAALRTIDLLAKYDEKAARQEYLSFMETNLAGMNIQLHGSDPVSVDSRFIFDPSFNYDTDTISSMLPEYFGLLKPLDEADGCDPSAGIVLMFQDELHAEAPSMELVITPRVNADGVPVLSVDVNDSPKQ